MVETGEKRRVSARVKAAAEEAKQAETPKPEDRPKKVRKIYARKPSNTPASIKKEVSAITTPKDLSSIQASPAPFSKLGKNSPLPVRPAQSASRTNGSEKGLLSIADSGILSASVMRSREKWIREGIFELYYRKGLRKNSKNVDEHFVNPHKDSMVYLGKARMTVEPHVFEVCLYGIRDVPLPAPSMPKPPAMKMSTIPGKATPGPRPLAANHGMSSHPNAQYPSSQQRPMGPPQSANMQSTPRPGLFPNPQEPPQAQRPSGQDPVIQELATRASHDANLKALMKVVASGAANKDQLARFQSQIDEITRTLQMRQAALAPPNTHVGTLPPGPGPRGPPNQTLNKTPTQSQSQSQPAPQTPTPTKPSTSDSIMKPPMPAPSQQPNTAQQSPIPMPTTPQNPASTPVVRQSPGLTPATQQPPATTPAASSFSSSTLANPSTPVVAPLPPKPAKPASPFDAMPTVYKGIALEFVIPGAAVNLTHDRVLFPKHAVLEHNTSRRVTASFLIVKRTTNPTDQSPGKRVHIPITAIFESDDPNSLSLLDRGVLRPDDAKRCIDEIVRTTDRANESELALQLPAPDTAHDNKVDRRSSLLANVTNTRASPGDAAPVTRGRGKKKEEDIEGLCKFCYGPVPDQAQIQYDGLALCKTCVALRIKAQAGIGAKIIVQSMPREVRAGRVLAF